MQRGMHRTGSAGLWGQSLGRGRDGQCRREPEQDQGCQAACAQHQLWFSAVPGSWDIGLSCLVTILQDKEPSRSPKGHLASVQGSRGPRAAALAHMGRSGAVAAALTEPPAAPRLPNAAAEPGQLLRPCPRAAALRCHPCAAAAGSAPTAARAVAQTWKHQIPFTPGPSGACPSRSALAVTGPCASQPGAATGHEVPSLGSVRGAAPARRAMNSSHVCQQTLGTAGHGTGTVSARPARSSLPGSRRNGSTCSPVTYLLFF